MHFIEIFLEAVLKNEPETPINKGFASFYAEANPLKILLGFIRLCVFG
jgi:hypothetical protein